MSVFDRDMFGKSKHDIAIGIIRAFCAGKRTLVAFSGGKDSQCCYHLCAEAGIEFTAQLSLTRFEPPEILAFVREHYRDVIVRRAYSRSLVADIELHGLPTRWGRWCCAAKHARTEGYDISVIGIRAAESARRRAMWRAFGVTPDHTAYCCPIVAWTEEEVWEYLAARGVPHCPLYDEGMRRIGCVCCPLNPSHMRAEAARWPKTASMLRQGADRYVARMRSHGFVTRAGRPCADWCRAASPEDEFWGRWIATGQTSMPIEACSVSDDECPLLGTGFAEEDADGGEGDAP